MGFASYCNDRNVCGEFLHEMLDVVGSAYSGTRKEIRSSGGYRDEMSFNDICVQGGPGDTYRLFCDGLEGNPVSDRSGDRL